MFKYNLNTIIQTLELFPTTHLRLTDRWFFQITLGRSTKDNQIDVDLSLEGPAWKISRRQGMIRLWNTGEFYITNEGKRPIYVDAQPVLPGSKQLLHNNSVIEVRCDYAFSCIGPSWYCIKHEDTYNTY